MRGFEDVPVDWAPAIVWVDADGIRHQGLRFIVPGQPVPKGNLIKGRWGGYHDPTKGLDVWLAKVADQARAAMSGDYRRRELAATIGFAAPKTLPLFSSAINVDVTFVLPRPKTITPPKWLVGDELAQWKSMAKTHTPPHLKKPDRDKLLRAVCDAMTGIVYHDDSQIIDGYTQKRYAEVDESTGAIIKVTSNVVI